MWEARGKSAKTAVAKSARNAREDFFVFIFDIFFVFFFVVLTMGTCACVCIFVARKRVWQNKERKNERMTQRKERRERVADVLHQLLLWFRFAFG